MILSTLGLILVLVCTRKLQEPFNNRLIGHAYAHFHMLDLSVLFCSSNCNIPFAIEKTSYIRQGYGLDSVQTSGTAGFSQIIAPTSSAAKSCFRRTIVFYLEDRVARFTNFRNHNMASIAG